MGTRGKEKLKFIKGQWAAEEIALERVASKFFKMIALCFGFHAFGNDREAQRVAEGNDGLRNDLALDVGHHVADEGAIDLQLVNGQAAEVGQRGIAGSKIVDRELHALCLESFHKDDGFLDVFNQHALGEFELELAGICAGALKHSQYPIDEARLAELHSADVDSEGEMGHGDMGGPSRKLRAGCLQNPVAERENEAGLFSQRDEFARGEDSPAGVVPADQGFRTDGPG